MDLLITQFHLDPRCINHLDQNFLFSIPERNVVHRFAFHNRRYLQIAIKHNCLALKTKLQQHVSAPIKPSLSCVYI